MINQLPNEFLANHNRQSFTVCSNKYVAKIEWNKEDNLYIGTLISEIYPNEVLSPVLGSIYFHGKDCNEVIEMFYQVCDNYEMMNNLKEFLIDPASV